MSRKNIKLSELQEQKEKKEWEFPKQPDHFVWDVKKAYAEHTEGAKWLEEIVMRWHGLNRYDRRIPLALWDIWENATPGCNNMEKE